MTADIVLYKADVVPVGEDQLPHLEIAREIARRFNNLFGDTFPEPQAKLTRFPMVIGLDGKDKMSKQLDNDIELALTPEETAKRVMTAVTDPARRFRKDLGHPEVCNVYSLQKYFNSPEADGIAEKCRSAQIGCVECKKMLAEAINSALAPFRERRAEIESRQGYLEEVILDGAKRAREIASQTMIEVREKMGLA
jgi:tryptophanyl-tRNA synthetase